MVELDLSSYVRNLLKRNLMILWQWYLSMSNWHMTAPRQN